MGEPGGLPSMGSQSRTQLKQLSSSSSLSQVPLNPLLALTSTLGPLGALPHPVCGLPSPVWQKEKRVAEDEMVR